MGSRSGYVVKRDGVTKAYGSRRSGSSTVAWLLRGPEKATAKFIGTGELPEIDDVLGGEDGAALIDWDGKVVLWMMANAHLGVYQSLCNRMIGQAFRGWNVRMVHDLYEISEYAGVETSQYIYDEPQGDERDWGDCSQEEIQAILAAEEAALATTEDDIWEPMAIPDNLSSLQEIEETGDWVVIRKADGTVKDYFGFGSLHNDLLKGERFANDLERLPSLGEIPPELVTCDGLLIDWKDKTVWRRNIGAEAVEQHYRQKWPGWTMKQIPGGNWAGQVELSGRDPGTKATSERDLLGLVVADLAPVHSADIDVSLGNIFAKTQIGCGAITVLLGLCAAVAYFGLKSMTGGVVIGALFLVSLFVTAVVFIMTKTATETLDLNESPREQCDAMDKILASLNYPSIAQLKESGEIKPEDDEPEDDDEE